MTQTAQRPPKPSSRQSNEIARIALRYGRSEWYTRTDGVAILSCWGDDPDPASGPLVFYLDRNGIVVQRSGPIRTPAVAEREE